MAVHAARPSLVLHRRHLAREPGRRGLHHAHHRAGGGCRALSLAADRAASTRSLGGLARPACSRRGRAGALPKGSLEVTARLSAGAGAGGTALIMADDQSLERFVGGPGAGLCDRARRDPPRRQALALDVVHLPPARRTGAQRDGKFLRHPLAGGGARLSAITPCSGPATSNVSLRCRISASAIRLRYSVSRCNETALLPDIVRGGAANAAVRRRARSLVRGAA